MYNQNIKMAITRLPDFAPFLRWCVCVRRSITVTLSGVSGYGCTITQDCDYGFTSSNLICLQKKLVSFM